MNNETKKIALPRRDLLKYSGLVAGGLTLSRSVFAENSIGDLDKQYFPGFKSMKVETAPGVSIHTLVGGKGDPVLLLHGAPQSHLSWAKVATELAKDYTVVATDLRGYGWSSKPDGGEDHINYSKRTMANDQVAVMKHLGFDQFYLIGHDRGGRVARRLAIDHPDKVKKLSVLDIVPAHYLYAHTTREFAESYIHWFIFIRPAPFGENFIEKTGAFKGRGTEGSVYADPAAVHAMCEDYRASANIDIKNDEADIAAKNFIKCPLRVLWGDSASMGKLYDVLGIWQMEASNATGKAMPGGHSFHSQNPRETYEELIAFLRA